MRTKGQLSGTVVLRGFIYGSSFNYAKKNRMAIPANFFGKYDGQYAANVMILGKYTPLDFETSEPINALDCLLTKTPYGPEVAVDKNFAMSWVRNWQNWLDFDTFRGTGSSPSGHLRCRECTSAFLGVTMDTNPTAPGGAPWLSNPLNMLNLYGFGRISWNTQMTADAVYAEWLTLTFGATFPAAARAHVLQVVNALYSYTMRIHYTHTLYSCTIRLHCTPFPPCAADHHPLRNSRRPALHLPRLPRSVELGGD
jgi:alpha-glucuronidase